MTVLALEHAGQGPPCERKHGVEVDLHLSLDRTRRLLYERADVCGAGVVDQHVDRPTRNVHGPIDESIHLVGSARSTTSGCPAISAANASRDAPVRAATTTRAPRSDSYRATCAPSPYD